MKPEIGMTIEFIDEDAAFDGNAGVYGEDASGIYTVVDVSRYPTVVGVKAVRHYYQTDAWNLNLYDWERQVACGSITVLE